MKIKLHSYWRSSSSWRVRAALGLKGIEYEYVPVHLVNNGGEQHDPAFHSLNAMDQVPVLEVEVQGQAHKLMQSMAIIEFIDERFPAPRLLPIDGFKRAHARQLAEIVNSGIQPLQNLAVIQKLRDELGQDAKAWCAHWIAQGLAAYEAAVLSNPGPFSISDEPTMADVFLVPQLYNARRFDLDLSLYPTLLRIEETCFEVEAFLSSHPDNQPDAVLT